MNAMTPTLREEIRQSRPFESLEQEAYLNLVRTAAALTDDLEQVLRPFGLTGPQYNVLRILQGAGPQGLCRIEVRDRMLTRMPDMTRLLDRMERAGLVERERSAEDRRLVSTCITKQGRELLEKVSAAIDREHHRGLGHLGRQQLRALIELLTALRRGE
jgi:DNA-binding MarR family transcriptional regulator